MEGGFVLRLVVELLLLDSQDITIKAYTVLRFQIHSRVGAEVITLI